MLGNHLSGRKARFLEDRVLAAERGAAVGLEQCLGNKIRSFLSKIHREQPTTYSTDTLCRRNFVSSGLVENVTADTVEELNSGHMLATCMYYHTMLTPSIHRRGGGE